MIPFYLFFITYSLSDSKIIRIGLTLLLSMAHTHSQPTDGNNRAGRLSYDHRQKGGRAAGGGEISAHINSKSRGVSVFLGFVVGVVLDARCVCVWQRRDPVCAGERG